MTNVPRRQRTMPPPIPPLDRAPNITMPLDARDILAVLDDADDERTPVPGPAPASTPRDA